MVRRSIPISLRFLTPNSSSMKQPQKCFLNRSLGRVSKSTFWYQPELGYAVKFQRELRRYNTPDIIVREMSGYKRGAG